VFSFAAGGVVHQPRPRMAGGAATGLITNAAYASRHEPDRPHDQDDARTPPR
jgi:hypothetical protein